MEEAFSWPNAPATGAGVVLLKADEGGLSLLVGEKAIFAGRCWGDDSGDEAGDETGEASAGEESAAVEGRVLNVDKESAPFGCSVGLPNTEAPVLCPNTLLLLLPNTDF